MHSLETRVLLPKDLKPVNSLADYKAQGGLKALKKARELKPQQIIDEVKAAGLRGRGGAGFPTAIKWQTVHDAEDQKKYLVCNFAEGEPGTYKDRYLCSKNPYIILEGMLISALVIDAREAIVGTKEKFKDIVIRLKGAIKEFEEEGVVEPGYLRLVLGPDSYLFGEEKGLLEVVDGRAPMPRFFPPYMYGVNVGPNETNPAVVNNAESMAQVAVILRDGAQEYRQNGFDDTPGTSIITLTGDVKKPGMYEISLGITARELIYDLGGGPKDKPIKAVFSGVSNRIMTPDQFDLQMGFGTLRAAGLGLGSGGFMVYDETRSMVGLAYIFSRFLAFSSCGQCIPCNSGTRNITEHLENLRNGNGSKADLEEILAVTGRCTDQTRCFLPTQESVVMQNFLEKFSAEFEHCANGNPVVQENELFIPKVQYFDEEKGEFTFESDPIEFREELVYF